MESFVTEKSKKIFLFCVFTLAAFLVSFHFTETPRVWVDEGVYTEAAKNFAFSGVLGLQTAPGEYFLLHNLLSVGYPVIFPVAMSFHLFDTGIWQARLPMLLYMFALVVVFYLFAKKRYGFVAALMSVGLLISFAPFYGNGRPVQGEVAGLVFLVLGALFLLFWEEHNFKNKEWALSSGLAFGLAAATKPIYLIVLSAALVVTFVLCVKKFYKKDFLIFSFGFILPVMLWLVMTFPTVDMAIKGFLTYLFLSGNHNSGLSGIETVTQNSLRFFTESTPILFLILFTVTAISFVLRYRRKTTPHVSVAEVLIFSFVLINLVTYLKGTGWYRYFFPAHTLLYLLFPFAILTFARAVEKPFLKKLIFAIPLVLLIFQFYHVVFLADTALMKRQSGSAELADAFSGVVPSQTVRFDDSVEAIIFLKGNNYSQYLGMEDFLVAGNRDAMNVPTEDIVLTSRSHDPDYSLPCYERRSVSRYELFERIPDCKQ